MKSQDLIFSVRIRSLIWLLVTLAVACLVKLLAPQVNNSLSLGPWTFVCSEGLSLLSSGKLPFVFQDTNKMPPSQRTFSILTLLSSGQTWLLLCGSWALRSTPLVECPVHQPPVHFSLLLIFHDLDYSFLSFVPDFWEHTRINKGIQ